ncbi:hypothetical protein SOHN41_02274 [Shewanella sp. HN-41]|nr:hypothetical protein SOHN41_02274 [Shewanella sp. HN-41]
MSNQQKPFLCKVIAFILMIYTTLLVPTTYYAFYCQLLE